MEPSTAIVQTEADENDQVMLQSVAWNCAYLYDNDDATAYVTNTNIFIRDGFKIISTSSESAR